MPRVKPRATHEYTSGNLNDALEFLKRTRDELRALRKVHVWPDCVEVFDVNGDSFQLRGIGYVDSNVVALLESINAVFNPEQVHKPIDRPYKEFKTGKQHPWAEDRIL